MNTPSLEAPKVAGKPTSYDATPPKKNKAITEVEYKGFQRAFDFFNRELFAGSLPHLLVTLQRRSRSRGYFSPHRFSERTAHSRAHELALNPDQFTNHTDEEVLSVLVHEMTHLWQETFGRPSRSYRYHNVEWGTKMKEVGLYPSRTGELGGKETGSSVSHYILPAGPYAAAYAKLAETGFKLHWQSTPPTKERERSKESKTKFTCARCGQNAWAKPDARLGCLACDGVEPMFAAKVNGSQAEES